MEINCHTLLTLVLDGCSVLWPFHSWGESLQFSLDRRLGARVVQYVEAKRIISAPVKYWTLAFQLKTSYLADGAVLALHWVDWIWKNNFVVLQDSVSYMFHISPSASCLLIMIFVGRESMDLTSRWNMAEETRFATISRKSSNLISFSYKFLWVYKLMLYRTVMLVKVMMVLWEF
jgi:hypothetical protein